jgi:hypothetical protein
MIRFDKARWFLALPLTAASSLGFVRAPGVTDRPVCQVASEWVAARHGNLPSTLDEIRKYPTLYQRTIYGNLSPAQRASIWQEKLGQLVAPQSGLTEQQRDVVATLAHRLDVYSADPNGLLHAIQLQQDGVDDRIGKAFDEVTAHRLFGELDESADTSAAASLRVGIIKQAGIAGSLVEFAGAIAQALGDEPAKAAFSTCSCHVGDSTGCPFASRCETPHAGDHCTTSVFPDCGVSHEDSCDGLCY